MYQNNQEIYTVRTLECDICERFDSILLTKEELEQKVSSNSLQIGSKILSHKDHLRIVYFDINANYLGDTMSLNFSIERQHIDYSKDIPYLLDKEGENLKLHKKMLKFFIKKQYKITILGPSMAGKTSLSLFLESGLPERVTHRVNHAATLGKSIRRFKLSNNQMTIMDMGGQRDFWSMWSENIKIADKVIFVLDGAANNQSEIIESLQLVMNSIKEPTTILIIHNKMDLYLEGYSNSFIPPEAIIPKISIPENIEFWVIKASIYNGLVYDYTNLNEETKLSNAIIDFLNR